MPNLKLFACRPWNFSYAISHARGIYRRLRMQQPKLKIIIGLWNYPEDPVKAAMEISGGGNRNWCALLWV